MDSIPTTTRKYKAYFNKPSILLCIKYETMSEQSHTIPSSNTHTWTCILKMREWKERLMMYVVSCSEKRKIYFFVYCVQCVEYTLCCIAWMCVIAFKFCFCSKMEQNIIINTLYKCCALHCSSPERNEWKKTTREWTKRNKQIITAYTNFCR